MSEREHGVGRGVPDRIVPGRTFVGIGAGVLVLAVVYIVTAGEEAGASMLVLASALSLWCGVYLWVRLRSPADDASGGDDAEEAFLPVSSPWPFGIGVGAFLLANGLLIGGWFFVPGATVLALGIGGFVRESRLREQ